MAVVLFTSVVSFNGQTIITIQAQTTPNYPYTIAVVGDWDCNSEAEKTVANIQQVNPDIILSTGDMSYESSADCWLQQIAPIKDKMLISQGNHDSNYDDYLAAFGNPGTWFAKEVPAANAVFISVNTEEDLDTGSGQLQFLDKTLTDTKAAWKITFMHKPSITYGDHPSSEGAPETLLPLYDKTKTSIEYSGHNHFMQEIYPTVDAGNGEPEKVAPGEGTVHIVSGGGGRNIYDFESNEVVAQSIGDHGIVKTVLLDDKTAKSEFISNDGQVTPMSDIINRNTFGSIPPPPLVEICGDGIDNNNNGQVDEGCPPPPPPPPPVCPPGQHMENGVCVPDIIVPPPPECPPGQHLENGVCVPDTIPPPPPPPPVPPVGNQSQISILNEIQNTESFGQWNNTDYTNFYNVKNLFDNMTNSWSFWSQYGKSAGWSAQFNPLQYPVCSAEIDVFDPKSTPFSLKIGNNESVQEINSVLDTTKEIMNIPDCLANATAMMFTSDAPGNWTTLSEVRLFSNQTTTTPPPVEPPVCGPGTTWNPETQTCEPDIVVPPGEPPTPTTNITKLNIHNSTVYANITDSKVVLNIGGNCQVIENNANPPVIPPPPPVVPPEGEEEERRGRRRRGGG